MTAPHDAGPARVALEDGTTFEGRSFGAIGTRTGEACFTTGMTGYQEVLTDPSYHGQIVTMTAVHVGNTGTNDHDDQSVRPWVAGFVVRELSRAPSSWRAESPLNDYLSRHGVVGVEGIDTRRLTRHIRTRGAMKAAISNDGHGADELVDVARSGPSYVGRDLVAEVTTDKAYEWGSPQSGPRQASGFSAGAEASPSTARLMERGDGAGRRRIVAVDLGIKRNILDLLVHAGFEVTVVPATTSAEEILARHPDGVFLSNGPGDPEPVGYAIETVASLVGKLPIFGICLGHQILGLALGARTFKLPFGHRGLNHPVKRLNDPRIEITCQNHGFAVDAESLENTRAVLTHVNLNDGTMEGLEVPGIAYSVQYHPEAGPGPHDSRYLFEAFRDLIARFEPSETLRV